MKKFGFLAAGLLMLGSQSAVAEEVTPVAVADVFNEGAGPTIERMLIEFSAADQLAVGESAEVWDVAVLTQQRVRKGTELWGEAVEFNGWLRQYFEAYAFLYTDQDGVLQLDVTIRWENGDPSERIEWDVRSYGSGEQGSATSAPTSSPYALHRRGLTSLTCGCDKTGTDTCDEDDNDCDYLHSCNNGSCAWTRPVVF